MAKIISGTDELMKKILDVYGIPIKFVSNISLNIPSYGLSTLQVDLIAIKELEDIEYGALKKGKVVLKEKTIFSYSVEDETEE